MLIDRLSPCDPNSYSRPGNIKWYFNKGSVLSVVVYGYGYVLLVLAVENSYFCVVTKKTFIIADEAKVTNIDLNIEVDFDNQILSGNAILSVEKVNSEAKVLVRFVSNCKYIGLINVKILRADSWYSGFNDQQCIRCQNKQ